MSESKSPVFVVEENTIIDGWINNWTIEDDKPEYFDTHDLAMAAIYEFFADLSRAGMAQQYDMEDYRVSKRNGLSDLRRSSNP